MPGDFNQGFSQVTIDGRTLADLSEFTEPEIADSDASPIMAGGSRSVGQNFTSLANSGEIPFKVTYPSEDSEFLFKLAQTKRRVSFVWKYVDPTEFPDGEMISFACEGRLVRSAHTKGATADPRDFTFKFSRGYTAEFKNKAPLTVP